MERAASHEDEERDLAALIASVRVHPNGNKPSGEKRL
jgi:hypothetical protein